MQLGCCPPRPRPGSACRLMVVAAHAPRAICPRFSLLPALCRHASPLPLRHITATRPLPACLPASIAVCVQRHDRRAAAAPAAAGAGGSGGGLLLAAPAPHAAAAGVAAEVGDACVAAGLGCAVLQAAAGLTESCCTPPAPCQYAACLSIPSFPLTSLCVFLPPRLLQLEPVPAAAGASQPAAAAGPHAAAPHAGTAAGGSGGGSSCWGSSSRRGDTTGGAAARPYT